MPATEQTWRNQRGLHRIFMISGVCLLGATLWMLAADHNREWKRYQDQARNVELQFNEWQQEQFETNEQFREHERLTRAFDVSRAAPIPTDAIDEFAAELTRFATLETKAARERDPNAREIAPVSIDSIKARLAKSQNGNAESGRSEGDKANVDESEQGGPDQKAIALRANILDDLREIVSKVRFDERVMLDRKKKRNADLDAAKANVDIGVRDNVPEKQANELQTIVNNIQGDVLALTLNHQRLNDHRQALESILKRITTNEDEAKKRMESQTASLRSLQSAYKSRDLAYINWVGPVPMPGKRLLTLPIVDAFQSPRKIENLWSDDNTIDYNFRRVRRFDRCTTCHQLLEKSQAGTADVPAFIAATNLTLTLQTPDKAKRDELIKAFAASATNANADREPKDSPAAAKSSELDANAQLLAVYGLRLSEEGLLDKADVTVSLVMPESAAAKADITNGHGKLTGADIRKMLLEGTDPAGGDASVAYPKQAGLMSGDVILEVDGSSVRGRGQADRQLLESVTWGKPLRLTVRRGMPNPYTSHPRLDLFVGSLSPHKAASFGCTTCHEGQGSATSFQWASHTPNSANERKEWLNDHHWAENPHWIYPMYSKRFAESTCLKCHHEVLELEPSARFPDAPAPKVTHGYHLVLKYGCYGCHEINGYDGPNRRIGPDMRLEPNFFAAAQQIKSTPDFAKLDSEQQGWVDELIEHPERDSVRRRLYEVLVKPREPDAAFTAATVKLASVLKDVETPGIERKPGPSLRFAASKMDADFLYDWIANPKHFRPSTRMPRFFGLHDHLADDPEQEKIADDREPLEILGMVEYLRQRSQNFEYLNAPANITPSERDAQIERGRIAFEERGCLACHNHKEFGGIEGFRGAEEIVQGPDLSAIGSKFGEDRHDQGRRWLYSWIRQPTKYHVRTVMPDLYLDPIEKRDESGKVVSVTDPVADIVEFLLGSRSDWSIDKSSIPSVADEATQEKLNELVLENLKEAFSTQTALRYLRNGIPAARSAELKGAESELVISDADGKLSEKQKLLYIGRKSIGKYGCFGCHDIPAFEDAKPIGTGLADWGRKDPSKLALEHITHYIEHGHGHAHSAAKHDAHSDHAHDSEANHQASHGDGGGKDFGATALQESADQEFFHEQLEGGNRIGFLWQKLKEPRSYDYRKTENKRYNERLRMPLFPFTSGEREAVMTFVLGLVADPPSSKYLYRPDERNSALIEGRRVLDKYNCGGCHLLAPQKWELTYGEGEIQPPEFQGFPFMKSHVDVAQAKQSTKVDVRGRLKADVHGMPTVADENAQPIIDDDQGDRVEPDSSYDINKLTFRFDLWQPAVIAGQSYETGVMPLALTSAQIEKRYATDGGTLARYLLSPVIAREKEVNQGAKGGEAWAWVPPPLIGEGSKVQSAWLHDFLLNPYKIRPATVLRMPRFNMSSEEASKLAAYFSAVDNVEYPYDFNARRQSDYLTREESGYQAGLKSSNDARKTTRLEDAMRIVTNNNYCVKCHIVGDYEPKGAERAKAPNLARIYERLRPEYVRRWIANPKQILPYTSMPQNIPYPAGIDKKLYHGDSIQQVDALVDLLMNYDEFAKRRSLVEPIVQQNQTTTPAAGAAGGGSASGGGSE